MKPSRHKMDASGFSLPSNCWLLATCFLVACCQSYADDQDSSLETKPSAGGVIAYDAFDYPFGSLQGADRGVGWKQPWRVSGVASPLIIEAAVASNPTQPSAPRALQIQGTAARNNPLRRELKQALSGQEVFVRFAFHYQGSEAGPSTVDPEFFVLWLDRLEGGDRSTHSANVPNIGVHIADRGAKNGKNVFMVRIGSVQTAWSKVELQENRSYQVVGRLTKSQEGARADFDQLDLWVDPKLTDLHSPDATISGVQGISLVRWVGFSTGLKTEATDRIRVGDLVLGQSWESVLDDSAARLVAANKSHGHNGVVWDKPVDFKRDVYPLLESRCFVCHSGTNSDSGYRLDIHRELLGYSTGEVLAEPGRSHDSRLIKVVAAEKEQDRMPPDGDDPLADVQVAMLRAWIDQGMKWDDALLPPPKRESDHWAFQSIVRPDVPQVKNSRWIRTPVDAFITKAHAEAGLTHARQATRRTLVRRLYLDLIGLPPTPEQVNEFLRDRSPAAYETLVEELLGSPHYGERGRYWLDLARWAESHGYQHDIIRPYAWRYRDYVIDSFNNDKPYDRFLKEQLAGDELQPYSDENLIATGFLGAARISGNQEDDGIQRNDVLVDIVNATGSVMLGLTLECAQCHNHKFDPISQRDYYRLQGFFVKGQLGNLSLRDAGALNLADLEQWTSTAAYNFYVKEEKVLIKKRLFERTGKAHTWGYLSAATGDLGIKRLSVVNRKPIPWQRAALKNAEARLLIRGNVAYPGAVVGSGWPEVLGVTPSSLGEKPRSALTDWMTDPSNPLVSRVWVNRLWQYHFGRGLVATSSDFGVEGAEPTHLELLDWLATELMNNGWSTKHIHRQIVMSSTYRQQRKSNEYNAAIDPNNRLLWCWPRRRLAAESIRDSVLVATGELNRSIGGISVPPLRQEENLRRTVYLFQQRSDMPSVMAMFDAPIGIASCSRRSVSTVALQPLFMLNSQFMAKRASAFADVVSGIAGSDIDRQIEVAFERTLSRKPDDKESKMARSILQTGSSDDQQGSDQRDEVGRPLMQLCHALMNLNEFVYIP